MMYRYSELPPRSKHFETLFHGTIIENTALICKEGIKRGSFERIGEISKHDPMIGEERLDDCIGTVSMSRNQKGAIFFACAWRPMTEIKGDHGQAIFEVDPSKLDKNKMFFRDMFGKRFAEVKYIDDIPPEAIKRVFIRKFNWEDEEMKVQEKYITCNEVLQNGL
jgi:hypothetical protein